MKLRTFAAVAALAAAIGVPAAGAANVDSHAPAKHAIYSHTPDKYAADAYAPGKHAVYARTPDVHLFMRTPGRHADAIRYVRVGRAYV